MIHDQVGVSTDMIYLVHIVVCTYGSGMIYDQVVCPPTCRNYLVLIVVCTAMIHDQVVCPPTFRIY